MTCYGGLGDYHKAVARGEAPWSRDELLEKTNASELISMPGERFFYSNIGYKYVRELVEEATGLALGDAVREIVLHDIDVTSIAQVFEPHDLDATAWGNAVGYHPGWVYHGLFIGSSEDAVTFLDALMTGKILNAGTLDQMKVKTHVADVVPGRPIREAAYGLGLMMGRMEKSGWAYGHTGGGPGSTCAIYHFPDGSAPGTFAAFAEGDFEGSVEVEVDDLASRTA